MVQSKGCRVTCAGGQVFVGSFAAVVSYFEKATGGNVCFEELHRLQDAPVSIYAPLQASTFETGDREQESRCNPDGCVEASMVAGDEDALLVESLMRRTSFEASNDFINRKRYARVLSFGSDSTSPRLTRISL